MKKKIISKINKGRYFDCQILDVKTNVQYHALLDEASVLEIEFKERAKLSPELEKMLEELLEAKYNEAMNTAAEDAASESL